MNDEDLKSQADYSGGHREAARRILVELVNILHDYKEEMVIIGGWVPALLFPDKMHIGSIDVDILLNHLRLNEKSYLSIEGTLLKNGYIKHQEKYFSYVKRVVVNEISYDVDVDLLAGRYGGTSEDHRSQHVNGLRALKATGGNFAFEIRPVEVIINAQRPDGAWDNGRIPVVSIVPFLVMKAAALGRGKAKDAYDIYFCVNNYIGGVEALSQAIMEVGRHGAIDAMLEKFQEKFASPNHAGCQDVVNFLDENDPEAAEIVKRDVFERMNRLVELLKR